MSSHPSNDADNEKTEEAAPRSIVGFPLFLVHVSTFPFLLALH